MLISISKRKGRGNFYKIAYNKLNRKKQCTYNDRTGEIFDTKYGQFIILKYVNTDNVYGKFLNSGYKTKTTISNLKRNIIKDYLYPSVFNVGYLGLEFNDISKKYPKFYRKVESVWRGMLKRCYLPEDAAYMGYGGAGVTVDKRWHNFSNFFYDIQKLDGWSKELFLLPSSNPDRITLDKDKLQQNISKHQMKYSKNTCCWLNRLEQCAISCAKTFEVTHPDGSTSVEHNMTNFAQIHKLYISDMSKCIKGELKKHKGYRFKPIEKCND